MTTDKIIMYDSPEAAIFKTGIEGWVSSTGTFWGNDEHMARWSGCTHFKCKECGSAHRKSWTICKECRSKKQEEKEREAYAEMDVVEWDGKGFIATIDGNEYFSSWDEVNDYCHDLGLAVADLMLVICEGVELPEIDINDYFSDCMHEDQDINDIDSDILDAVDELNKLIRKARPMVYSTGDKAVKI